MHLLVLQNVLAAAELDGSSEIALRTAAELARLAGAELHVVHAAPTTGAELERGLAGAVRSAAPWTAASTCVEAGPPAEVIAEQATRSGAQVIVLGPHRSGPGENRALGGTADRVVRAAAVPCLVVPVPLRLPLRRVLAPIDLSETARGALGVALAWASALRLPGAGGDERTCLTVLHAEGAGGNGAGRQALQQEVESVRRSVSGFAGVRVEEVVEEDADPATAILRRAGEEDVDLVVIGTRGKGGAEGILGSVSAAVVRGAGCPVLLVPPDPSRRYVDDVGEGA
jgi:nucleotide-binding universal stress UspA family protein